MHETAPRCSVPPKHRSQCSFCYLFSFFCKSLKVITSAPADPVVLIYSTLSGDEWGPFPAPLIGFTSEYETLSSIMMHLKRVHWLQCFVWKSCFVSMWEYICPNTMLHFLCHKEGVKRHSKQAHPLEDNSVKAYEKLWLLHVSFGSFEMS